MKNIILLLLLTLIVGNDLFSQTHQLNHQKYWYYRYRMNTHFTKIGTGRGESLNFLVRGLNWGTPNSPTGGQYMRMGDQTIQMGQYMAVLALEYNMLAENNQNTNQTVKELWHLLYAFNRLDLTAESLYRPLPATPNSQEGIYYGPDPQSGDLNGFFVRDDLTGDFFADNQQKFTSNKVYSAANAVIDTAQSDFSYSERYWENGAYHNFGAITLCEESYDQVYRIMLGMAMIQKMIPQSVNYSGQAFQDGKTSLKDEAKAILDRVIFHANGTTSTSSWHHLKNPARLQHIDGQNTTFGFQDGDVGRGHVSGYSWAIAEAAKSMTSNFNEVSPLYYLGIPYTEFSSSPYHTLYSKTLGYYEWRGLNVNCQRME